eukprot:CAMPEP_0169266202 /NCGR_PEP_ID=MMETSP1016-20121227/46252_1 /TAXON_ID=342587 /ORGANISM="Karlodinium micrum, Strain CCMP2283" /LENGTH=80 /DNA_ID=CAMNT_0009350053 /DNA_START=548 /DNA_END=790 /DNA_ORIENTATION=-
MDVLAKTSSLSWRLQKMMERSARRHRAHSSYLGSNEDASKSRPPNPHNNQLNATSGPRLYWESGPTMIKMQSALADARNR